MQHPKIEPALKVYRLVDMTASIENMKKDLNEIDEITTSNLEVVSGTLDRTILSMQSLVKEFREVRKRSNTSDLRTKKKGSTRK